MFGNVQYNRETGLWSCTVGGETVVRGSKHDLEQVMDLWENSTPTSGGERMTLFSERETFELFDKENESTKPDAVLRVVVESSRDVKSRISFTVLRSDRKTVCYDFGLGWHKDLSAMASVLGSTGYDIAHAEPILRIKAWLFDFTG